MRHLSKTSRQARGMTLIEVLLAFSIFTLLSGMILALIINVNWSLYDSSNKQRIGRSFRMSDNSLLNLISKADYVWTYKEFSADSILAGRVLGSAMTGDLVVAVYYENPGQPLAAGGTDMRIARIVGVFRQYSTDKKKCPTRLDTGGPIYLFDSNLHSNTADWPTVFPTDPTEILATGGAAGINGMLAKLLPKAPSLNPGTRNSPAATLPYQKLADWAVAVEGDAANEKGIFTGTANGAIARIRIQYGSDTRTSSSTYTLPLLTTNL